LIAGRIREAFPRHRLIGEEGARGAQSGDAEPMPFGWVIDPLDGTTNFAHGYPHFAVSIALEHEGDPVLGVVFDPMRDELFVAERGDGATLNGEPISVSTSRELIVSLLATGFPYDLSRRGPSNALWDAFNGRCQGVRRDGSAALNLCYVAAGRLDGFWEQPLQAWDIGAGALLVREAGGTVTALDGGPFDLYDHQVLATNGHLHEPMREIIASTLATHAG
jgi:myo-inositol-1(or 4)-monophosphatase